MKYFLSVIVLLSTSQYALADMTLEFLDTGSNDTEPVITYQIKAHQLKLTEGGSGKINVFNQKTQQFVSLNPETGQYSVLNEDLINKGVSKFNQQRLQQLTAVEKELDKKLQTMPSTEQEVGESIINQLKYPELYGQHTLLSIKTRNKTKLVNKLSCKLYQLYRSETLLKEFCLADAASLGMSAEEYRTLRGFYAFDYSAQTRLMLALGKSQFTLVDYDKENMPGVIIETIQYQNNKIKHQLTLKRFSSRSLADSIFSIKKPSAKK